MTPKELTNAMHECWTQLWNKKTVYSKMLKTLKQTRNVKAAAWAFASNTERHNLAFGQQKSPWDIDKILSLK
jgi:hypothetical protein